MLLLQKLKFRTPNLMWEFSTSRTAFRTWKGFFINYTHEQGTQSLRSMLPSDFWEDDKQFTEWAEREDVLDECIQSLREQFIRSKLLELYQLDSKTVEAALKDIRKK